MVSSSVQPDCDAAWPLSACCVMLARHSVWFSLCCPVVLSLSPPHLAAGLWAVSLRWLIMSCLSRDNLPRGPSSITLYQRQPIELPPHPPRCATAWLITIHAAASPAELCHQYSVFRITSIKRQGSEH